MAGALLPPPKESQLQAAVVKYARLTGWTVWEMQKGSKGNASVYCTPGIPDLYFLRDRFALWMELKRGSLGRVSPHQHDRHAELTAASQRLYVCRTFEEARAVLDEVRARNVGSDQVQP